jgi:hypothetical protein
MATLYVRMREGRHMRDTSLRWGLGLGAVAAALGIVAQIIGSQLSPRPGSSSFDSLIRYLLIAGPLFLVVLGVALGLAYFAGLRSERDLPEDANAEEMKYQWGGPHRDSALSGTVVMACYWLITSMYNFVLNLRPGGQRVGDFLVQHAVQGIIYLLLGFGLGAMGGRAPAARRLLDEIAIAPQGAESTGGNAAGQAGLTSSAEGAEASVADAASEAPVPPAAASDDEPAG